MSGTTVRPKHRGKKLLVAAVGVATVSYAVHGCISETSGNLMPPPPEDASLPLDASGELHDANPFDGFFPVSGNLLPPPPLDATLPHDAAALDASAGDAEAPSDGGGADAGDGGDAAVRGDAGDAG